MLGQAVEAARKAGADEETQRAILEEVLEALGDVPPRSKPPEISYRVHRIVRQRAGNADPYREAKARSTEEALGLLPWMRRELAEAGDPLETAARMSIAGNIIDAIPGRQYALRDELQRVLDYPLAINDVERLRCALEDADWVLYLADNAGETVCDRLLIQTLGVPVRYAVKGSPIANDATIEDALAAGVDQDAELISTGSDAPGTLLETCSVSEVLSGRSCDHRQGPGQLRVPQRGRPCHLLSASGEVPGACQGRRRAPGKHHPLSRKRQ